MAGRGIYFSALGAGTLLFWSGFKGWGITATLQDIISGRQPAGPAVNAPQDVSTSNPLSAAAGTGALAGVSGIAADAAQYQGHAYRLGGAPGTSGKDPWDCSSFCNWVLSRDLGLPWPGAGRYDGSSHGPPTGSWGAWFRARGMAVKGGITAAQAGDVIVWANHMGIAAGGGQMISALNRSLGTRITPIQGYGNGPLLAVGRYGAAPAGQQPIIANGQNINDPNPPIPRLG